MLGALNPSTRRRLALPSKGVTLVEMMVAMAILAVLAAVALPSMRELIARKRLEGTAQELVTTLRLLKAHHLQNRPGGGTAIGFSSNSTKTCYVVYEIGVADPDCDCGQSVDNCDPALPAGGPVRVRQVDIPSSTGVQVSADRTNLPVFSYNAMPRSGETVRVTLTSATSGIVRVSTNETGLPLICSEPGNLGAIKACAP